MHTRLPPFYPAPPAYPPTVSGLLPNGQQHPSDPADPAYPAYQAHTDTIHSVSVLLLSTYDLGRQPFGLASPLAWLQRAGITVTARDLSRDPLSVSDVEGATLIAFYLPMHTATRLALPVIDRVKQLNPGARLAAYGLYAPLSEAVLRDRGVDSILGPEAEADLVQLAQHQPATSPARQLPRLSFVAPERTGLAALDRYASLQMPDGTRRVVGSTDATRGCKHRCRHCPIVPVYNGQFRVVPLDVVLADIDQQVGAGAEHVTFGDPDFFNGPTHARRIVESLHARHPSLTYDVTIKVEHLLKHCELLPVLAQTGCVFVTSAVESIDERVLEKLDKGHTRDDFFTAVRLCQDAGLNLAPTFVAFTPWTTRESYLDLLDTIDALELVDHVAPVQWGLRLLVTQGSRLLELEDIRSRVQPFDRVTLTYPWRHDDAEMDALQHQIMREVGVTMTRSRREVFEMVGRLAGFRPSQPSDRPARATIPYLDEPWYC
jgi:hypothetical protein